MVAVVVEDRVAVVVVAVAASERFPLINPIIAEERAALACPALELTEIPMSFRTEPRPSILIYK